MGFEEFCKEHDLDATLLDDLWLMDVLCALNSRYTVEEIMSIVYDYCENAGTIEKDIKESILKALEEK